MDKELLKLSKFEFRQTQRPHNPDYDTTRKNVSKEITPKRVGPTTSVTPTQLRGCLENI